MSQDNRCPECGAPLPGHSPLGLCPGCLLKGGLDSVPPSQGPGSPGNKFPPPTPEQLAGSFPDLEILEFVGRGGMGMVYKARQRHLNRLVALKILMPTIARDPAFAERFAREARAMAMLSHAHIVVVHDFGEARWALLSQASGAEQPAAQECPLYYFVMEFVDGLTLRQLLNAGKIAPQEALAIVPQICEALQYAHDKGVVHRDIKPENILIDRAGQVKIADFGLAKLMDQDARDFSITGEGQVMGTPYYMAPEQTERPRNVDHRADIYALGVVFYQMLTGELPLGRFAPPSRKVQVDVRLDEVVLRALEKEPELRFQQASDVKTEVEKIASTPGQRRSEERKPETEIERNALAQVKTPAIWLIVTGVVNWILFTAVFIVFGLLNMYAGEAMTPEGAPQPMNWLQPNPIPAGLMFAIPLLAMCLSGFVVYAGLRLMQLKCWGAGIAASILAIIIAPGNVIGLPIGIWALVVLSRRDVREAFQRQAANKGTAPVASQTWQSPTMGWGHFIGYLQGIAFTSPLAYKLANLSALGFLCFLGFMPLPGWKGCFGFSGIFGLIGLSTLIEMVARSKARRPGSNNQQPPSALKLGRWQGVLLLFGLILLSVAAFVVVLKQVISHQNPDVIQETSGNQGTAFGPMIEQTIALGNTATSFYSIDRVGFVLGPKDFQPLRDDENTSDEAAAIMRRLSKWMTDNNVDFLVRRSHGSLMLSMANMLAFQCDEAAFDNRTADDLLRDPTFHELAGKQYRFDFQSPLNAWRPGAKTTLAFQTRSERTGLVQVLDVSNDPPSVKIRYKLVQKTGNEPVRHPWPLAAHISHGGHSVYVIHDDVDPHYVFYYAGDFGTSSQSSQRPPAWLDQGGIELYPSSRTFGFHRDSDDPVHLQINGKEYNLRQGRVFVIRDKVRGVPGVDLGAALVEQRQLDVSLATAMDPDAMAKIVAEPYFEPAVEAESPITKDARPVSFAIGYGRPQKRNPYSACVTEGGFEIREESGRRVLLTAGAFSATALDNALWDAITPNQLVEKLKGAARTKSLRLDGPFPQTYGFSTYTFAAGVLQILGFTEDPTTVKFRYKLVNVEEPQPASVFPKVAKIQGEVLGPIVERFIADGNHEQSFYSLERGEYVPGPKDFPPLPQFENNAEAAKATLVQYSKWFADNGVDLLVQRSSGEPSLALSDIVASPVTDDHFNDSVAGLIDLFQDSHTKVTRYGCVLPQLLTLDCRTGCGTPMTMIFQTRHGRIGILQIAAVSVNPPGVKIRYKLVQKTPQTSANVSDSANKEKYAAVPWGEWNAGWSSRLRAEKDNWKAGELPTFNIDLRKRQGTEPDALRRTLHGCLVDVDGRQYRLSIMSTAWEHKIVFQPGATQLDFLTLQFHRDEHGMDVRLLDAGVWINSYQLEPVKKDPKDRAPEWKPGKHVVRVSVPFMQEVPLDKPEKYMAVSNFVEVFVGD